MSEPAFDPREKLRLEAVADAIKNEVAACPFCASQAVGGSVNLKGPEGDNWLSQVLTLALADDNQDADFRLWCWDCKISGPIAARMALAIKAWNNRPTKLCGCGRPLSVNEACAVCDRDE